MTRRQRVNEAAFQRQVTDALTLFGWRWQHQRPGRLKGDEWRTSVSGHVGFPDLVAVRGTRLLFAELKGDGGRLTPDQTNWITALRNVQTVDTYVWWPEHGPNIEQILRRADSPHPDTPDKNVIDEKHRWKPRPKAVDYRATEAETRARRAETERDAALEIIDQLRAEIERLTEKLAQP